MRMASVRMILAAGVMAAAGVLANVPWAAEADDYPNHPIRLIVPAAPGGILDILARLTADDLDKTFGQRVIVDNRGGASGNLGPDMVAKAPPDGYSLCLIQIGNVAANPHLFKDLTFDPLRDLQPVAPVASSAQIVTAYPGLPAKNLTELLALARQAPGTISYGSAGVGTSAHLGAALLEEMGHVKLLHVPYRGMAPALVDLTAGRVQLAFIGLAGIRSGLETGSLKALAVAQSTRLKAAPDIPSADEAGLPGYEFIAWFGVVTTGGTSPAIVQKLNSAINAMLKKPAIDQRLADNGMEPMIESPAAFAARIQSDYEKFGKIIREAGIKVE